MGENVDVKAMAARLRQTGMMAAAGGGAQRLPPPVFERGHHSPVDSGPNGGVRPRLNKPNTGSVSPANGLRSSPGPHGVFPRPPPSHRPNQEPVRPPIPEADKPGPFRNPGEKLVRPMPKPQGPLGARVPQAIQTAPMRSQRSLTGDVEPLLRPLPPIGPRPNKPKRPPFVNLEPFRRNPGTPKPIARLSGRISEDSNSPTTPRAAGPRPPLIPIKPSVPNHDEDDDQDMYDDIAALPPPPLTPPAQTQENLSPLKTAGRNSPPMKPSKPNSFTKSVSAQGLDDDQETYDDIELPPPPPPPPTQTQESWSDQHSSQAEEWDDSDGSEIYEEVDSPESIPPVPPDRSKQSQKDIKRQQELERKEQKDRQEKESKLRKKFKLTGNETALHVARVREDWQGGKNDLRVHQGDSVEIIRIDNNPEGRWLARTMDGNYGYISTKCVDMDYEEVKRRFGSFAKPRPDPGLYDDVDKFQEGYGCDDEFPPPPVEISPDPKTLHKMEKEEKEFRKKFKFEKPIQVLQYRRVDPNGKFKKVSGKYLNVVRGETLEVIELTNEKKLLCRNAHGKYGYVLTAYLLAEEGEIYDDIDHPGDVYDNDNNM